MNKFSKIFMVVAVAALMMFTACGKDVEESGAKSVDPKDYAVDSEERFVASMANFETLSYEQAWEKHQESKKEFLKADSDEIHYKTVNKVATTIKTNEDAYIARFVAEVAYLCNDKGEAYEIAEVSMPYAEIEGVTESAFEHGGFNVDETPTGIRISATGQFSFKADKSIEEGEDITGTGGGNTCTTKALTPVIEIDLEDYK